VGPETALKALGSHAAVAGGLTLLTAAPFLQTTNPTLGIAELATHTSTPAASTVLQNHVDSVVCRVGLCSFASWAELGVRIAFPLLLAAGLYMIVRALIRRRTEPSPEVHGAAWGWELLLFTLCSPVLLPGTRCGPCRSPGSYREFRELPSSPPPWRSPLLVMDYPSRFPNVADLIVWIERAGNVAVAAIVVVVAWELIRRGPSGSLLDVNGSRLGIVVENADEPPNQPKRVRPVG
jgi:hypothetical protein